MSGTRRPAHKRFAHRRRLAGLEPLALLAAGPLRSLETLIRAEERRDPERYRDLGWLRLGEVEHNTSSKRGVVVMP